MQHFYLAAHQSLVSHLDFILFLFTRVFCIAFFYLAGVFPGLWQHRCRPLQQPQGASVWPSVWALPGWNVVPPPERTTQDIKVYNTVTPRMLGQAQEFQVIGIRPSAESVILGNPWSGRACERFITLVKGQALVVSLYSIVQGVMRVELLISSETTDRSVADILIEEGHAVKAEESFVSVVTQCMTQDCCCRTSRVKECQTIEFHWPEPFKYQPISLEAYILNIMYNIVYASFIHKSFLCWL